MSGYDGKKLFCKIEMLFKRKTRKTDTEEYLRQLDCSGIFLIALGSISFENSEF